ncbi:MAG: rhodanese-like domain-containing protein [Pyrinomonadaceae bacterium]|nr:rhodanese-like domain-containing protein [Pyrinomonadaceae bacterium]
MKKILSLTAFLAVVLSILTACQSAASPVKIDAVKTEINAAPKTDAHGHADDAPRINLTDAKKDFDAGSAVFVDTRAETDFKSEHIKGAINIPMEAVELRYKEIPTGKKIIAYCS